MYKIDNISYSLIQRQKSFGWMQRVKKSCSIIIYLLWHNVDCDVTKFWTIVIYLYLHNIPDTLLTFVSCLLCLSVEMYFRILSLRCRRWKIHSSNNVYHFRRKEIVHLQISFCSVNGDIVVRILYKYWKVLTGQYIISCVNHYFR